MPISSTDAAPTLLHALGVTPPVQMHGRVVAEAFGGGGVEGQRGVMRAEGSEESRG